jgi:hypothetical protein
MKLSRIRFYGALLVTGLACAVAQAASLDSNNLPEGSNWYAHVNMDLIRSTDVGRQLMLETVDEALGDIEDELGVDLGNEVEGVTLFGGTLPVEQGAVILHGAISDGSQDAIMARLAEEETGVFATASGGMTFYTIPEGDGTMRYTEEGDHVEEVSFGHRDELYFSFGTAQTLVTHSMETMQNFLDSGGLLASMDSVDPGAMVVLQADRALMQGGANTSLDMGGPFDSSVLKNLDSVALVVSEDNGGLVINAELLANSPEVAMSVRNVVEGLVALKALEGSDDDMGAILRSVRFESEGEVLRVSIAVAADQIETLGNL